MEQKDAQLLTYGGAYRCLQLPVHLLSRGATGAVQLQIMTAPGQRRHLRNQKPGFSPDRHDRPGGAGGAGAVPPMPGQKSGKGNLLPIEKRGLGDVNRVVVRPLSRRQEKYSGKEWENQLAAFDQTLYMGCNDWTSADYTPEWSVREEQEKAQTQKRWDECAS